MSAEGIDPKRAAVIDRRYSAIFSNLQRVGSSRGGRSKVGCHQELSQRITTLPAAVLVPQPECSP